MRESIAEMFERYCHTTYGPALENIERENNFTFREVRRAFYRGVYAMLCQNGLKKEDAVRYENEIESFEKEVLAGSK